MACDGSALGAHGCRARGRFPERIKALNIIIFDGCLALRRRLELHLSITGRISAKDNAKCLRIVRHGTKIRKVIIVALLRDYLFTATGEPVESAIFWKPIEIQ